MLCSDFNNERMYLQQQWNAEGPGSPSAPPVPPCPAVFDLVGRENRHELHTRSMRGLGEDKVLVSVLRLR
jgi:hypothetical protein